MATGLLALACILAPAAAAPAAPAAARGLLMPGGPLVQLIDADTRDDHTNILVQFSCTVRFLSNTPVSHGKSTRITLRLGPDCGSPLSTVPAEFPQIGGGGELVTNARLESVAPGEVLLELTWSREMDFVMAPTSDAAGLRLRLFNIEPRRGSGLVLETSRNEVYSVNLDSSQQKFERGIIETAAASYKTQAFESEIDIDSEHWYRLRLGPYATRAEAERVLIVALNQFPRAWIAVNDEQGDLSATERAGVAAAPATPTDAPLPDVERSKILSDARAALDKHQFPEAIDGLSRLVRQPEYPARAEAQELLGLVRERAGQLAQAKAEYQAYLQRYPQGAGADRVRRRLQALAAASIAPRTFESGAARAGGWSMVGSTALGYQYDKGQTVSAGTTTSSSAINAALVYGDLLVRDRGSRYDFTGRVDAGYTHNSASTVGGSQDRTTAAYAELTDRSWGLSGRIGRQTLASQGIVGLFDGLALGYQLNPHFAISAAGGYPAYTSYSGFSLHQQFETLGVEYTPFLSLVVDAYVFNESEEGATDRRSLGIQTRFSRPGYTAIALVDYDVYFQQLNSATIIGNFRIGEHWIFGVNLDHRHSPLLELNNALIGQAALDLRSLQGSFSQAQIKQLAIDRGALSDTVVLSVSRSLGERWQVMGDIAALRLGSTPASGGVPGTPSTGLDKNASVQLAGSSLLRASDLHIFGVRYDNSPTSRSTTLSWDARFPIGGAWRFGPRFSVAQVDDPELGGKQTLYLPEVRADWTSRRQILEMIAGYQLQQQLVQQQLQNLTGAPQTTSLEQRNLYVSATYRLRF
ncbi:MAG TPA: SPOR domain-containing protein [Steroidobacteraceae bacterium]